MAFDCPLCSSLSMDSPIVVLHGVKKVWHHQTPFTPTSVTVLNRSSLYWWRKCPSNVHIHHLWSVSNTFYKPWLPYLWSTDVILLKSSKALCVWLWDIRTECLKVTLESVSPKQGGGGWITYSRYYNRMPLNIIPHLCFKSLLPLKVRCRLRANCTPW